MIRGSLSLGALVLLTGCDVKRPEAVESALLAISRSQRWRAGAAVRPEQAGADLSRLDDPETAQVQRLLRRDGREAGEWGDMAAGGVRSRRLLRLPGSMRSAGGCYGTGVAKYAAACSGRKRRRSSCQCRRSGNLQTAMARGMSSRHRRRNPTARLRSRCLTEHQSRLGMMSAW